MIFPGFLSVVLTLSIFTRGRAFAPVRVPQGRNFPTFKSEPSDTSSDGFFDDDTDVLIVETKEASSTETDSLVSSVLELVQSYGGVPDSKRATINEYLLKLEALNPTKEPAMSPLLNGIWKLRYASGYTAEGALNSPTRQLALFLYSGGYSPGLFALALAQSLPASVVQIEDLEISICPEQPRVEAEVLVNSFLGESAVCVKAKLGVESYCRLRETYESATVAGRPFELPKFLQYSREIYVTYLDEDIMVVRDASGVPELLVRKTSNF